MPWFIWLIIATLAVAGEVVSTALVLVYVGVAAAITALLAAAGVPALLQFIFFISIANNKILKRYGKFCHRTN